jgi:hypothetical protein
VACATLSAQAKNDEDITYHYRGDRWITFQSTNKAMKLLKVKPVQGSILVPEITQKMLGDLLNPVLLAKQKPLDSKSDFGG